MASCEWCWDRSAEEAHGTGKDQVEIYERLVRENDCTPEQQAGTEAHWCLNCRRKTVHQHTHRCMACGYKP